MGIWLDTPAERMAKNGRKTTMEGSASTALLIMAAGIGARFGGGIKQLEPVDAHGHIIMDYSIHDAIQAGFNKIVFIIRRDIESDFKAVIGDRVESICRQAGVQVAYAFQDMRQIPAGFTVPEGRQKPWGTGQAVLAAKERVDGPFAVINADDYYGKTTFGILHDWLCRPHGDTEYSLAGFILKNTLSDNGGVTRGVCQVDDSGYLTYVAETPNIVKTADGAAVNGRPIDVNAHVSMNMWGLSPAFLKLLEEGFLSFFQDTVPGNPLKAEFLLPIFIGQLLQQKKITVQVLETRDAWFGVTYQEDKPAVTANFRRLIADGVYREDLYSDFI
jgi:UTP-glucose-1-phosphate uridylyltransferase